MLEKIFGVKREDIRIVAEYSGSIQLRDLLENSRASRFKLKGNLREIYNACATQFNRRDMSGMLDTGDYETEIRIVPIL